MQGVFKDQRAVTHEGKIIIQVYVPMPPAPVGPRGPAFRAKPTAMQRHSLMVS